MPKPSFRETDEVTKRSGDIKITIPYIATVEASGATFVGIVLAALFVASSLGFGMWHHIETAQEFRLNREVQILQASIAAMNVCVNSLTSEERREYRVEGRHCPNPIDEIRAFIDGMKKRGAK